MKKYLAFFLAMAMALSCVGAFAEEGAAAGDTYTYQTALSSFPTIWNELDYETDTSSTIMGYISSGLYTFDFNENRDGYVFIPEMAAGEPIDVTADYVGEEWGIAEGETERAWIIPLRDDLKWEDGTPLTAYDYVETAKRLLDPVAANYRADSMWTGSYAIVNAEAYYKQGSTTPTAIGAVAAAAGMSVDDYVAAASADTKGYINWSYSFGDTYDFDAKAWTGSAADAVVETPLSIAELYEFYVSGPAHDLVASWGVDDATIKEYADGEVYVNYTYPAVDFANVGVQALSETELVYVLTVPSTGFYLKYGLPSFLVNCKLYDECSTVTDGVFNSTYGTSAETTMSYGPYKLTEYQTDKVFTFERNENWFGYGLPENEGYYQTDRVVINYVAETETNKEMFLSGQLETYGLASQDVAEYSASDYLYFEKGSSTFAVVVNPDLEGLTAAQTAAGENINKTIMTLKDFRMALSLSLDRQGFCNAARPLNVPAYSIFNDQIVADPETTTMYRNTDDAKATLLNFWGLSDEVGEGKMYATMDDAIDSITGINTDLAKQYFDAAYDEAIAQGLMDEDDVVQITIGLPSTREHYVLGYDFLSNMWTSAVEGTKLEGKLTFTQDTTIGDQFADTLKSNQVNMLFLVGWTGSSFNPYNLVGAYTQKNYQYDPCWDTSAVMLDITLKDGVTYTGSVLDWTQAYTKPVTMKTADGANADVYLPYSAEDADKNANRTLVLAALENAILQQYDFIPLMDDSSAVLKSMKINWPLEEEVFPLSYGQGMKYNTYNYTDAEWAEFVASQGGTLNYR